MALVVDVIYVKKGNEINGWTRTRILMSIRF